MMSKKNLAGSPAGYLAGRLDTQSGRAIVDASYAFLAGFIASRGKIFDGLSPFGMAAVAAYPKSGSIFVLLGAGLGYLLPGGPEYSIRYLAACAVIFIFRWLFSGFEEISGNPAFIPVLAGCASLLTAVAAVITNGISFTDILDMAAETLICACAALFFSSALPMLRHPGKIAAIGRRDLICVVITYGVFLLALSRLQVSGVSLGRILAVLSVLMAARYGNEAGGCLIGVSLGLILGLGQKDTALLPAGYGFGGLMAGIFSTQGRFGCAVALILANAVTGAYSGGSPQFIAGIYEIMGASLLFILLPENLLCRLSAFFFPIREYTAGDGSQGRAVLRLRSAAEALSEISDTLARVGGKLRNIGHDDISSVYTGAADISCKRCGMRMYCWGTAYNDTMDALNEMTETLLRHGELKRDDAPRHFAGRCCKLGEFLSCVNRCYGEYNARLSSRREADMLRGLLLEEYDSVSVFLKQLSGSIGSNCRFSRNDNELRAAFAACGLTAQETLFGFDENGRLRLDAKIEKKGKTVIRKDELLKGLSAACGRRLDGPEVLNDSRTLSLSFVQKPVYRCSFGKVSVPKDGEKLCGDAAETFSDEQGRAVMVISDGMGCGGRAAVDSNLAIRLMSRLLSSGFGYEPALRIVNTAMILKSGEESFATLDLAAVNLYTGDAEFLKAGAPPTYVRRCGRVEKISHSSMPVGILKEVTPERSQVHLRSGDLIVMASDGAVIGDDSWFARLVEAYPGGDPQGYARELIRAAKEHRADGHDDDVTVVIAEIL